MTDVLIRAEKIGKKFCRNLKKSLWYAVKDSASDLAGGRASDCSLLRDDEFWANKDISFELRAGDRLGLIGGNGAGKTTLLKMLNGLIKPDSGCVSIRGRVGSLIALGAGFNPVLSGRENIYVNASILGFSKREVDRLFDDIVDFSGISDAIDSPVRNYSSGMQVRLGFAVASTLRPDILLVDEVLAVGDIAFQARCFNRLGALQKDGVAFILVSHNMHHIEGFCQKAILLQHGRALHVGDTTEAVRLFSDIMDSENPAIPASADDNESPNGSGRIRIAEVKTEDTTGLKIKNSSPDDPVRLVVTLDSTVTASVECDVVAYRAGVNQPAVQFSNKQLAVALRVKPGQNVLTVYFPYLAVNATTIKFTIALWDLDRSELFDWSRDTTLSVSRAGSSTGALWLAPNMTIHQEIRS